MATPGSQTGGCDFPVDPELDAPDAPVFWNPEDAPAVAQFIAPLPPGLRSSSPARLVQPAQTRSEHDLTWARLDNGTVLVGAVDDRNRNPFGILLPLDDDWPIRLAAADGLRRTLIDRTADPPVSRQRRDLLKRALRCVDARRAGASYRYEIQASRLRNWLTDLEVGPTHLVGSSMGGAIATILAHRLEPAPASLTLLNSAGIPEHEGVDPEAPFESDRDRVLIPASLGAVYRMFNAVGSGRPHPGALATAALLGPDLLRRQHAHRHIFHDMPADALAPMRYLGTQPMPLQVQWGDRDTITPTRCVDYFRRTTPAADIRLFRGVGHLPMLEVPGRSARALVEQVEAASGR